MIETFVSRPNWAPDVIEDKLSGFYQLLEDTGFKSNTIGKTQASLKSPFQDVTKLMNKCKCTIVLGLPQIFMKSGSIKSSKIQSPITLATEWNQIEATMSLMLQLPTLVLLHKTVAARGIFDRGAADVFVYEFDSLDSGWPNSIRPALNALKAEVEERAQNS
jgi:hypothetical protein